MKNIRSFGKIKRKRTHWPVWLVALALVFGAGVVGPSMAKSSVIDYLWWDEGLIVNETVKTGFISPEFDEVVTPCPMPEVSESTISILVTKPNTGFGIHQYQFTLDNNGDVPIKVVKPFGETTMPFQYAIPGTGSDYVYVTKNDYYLKLGTTAEPFDGIVLDPGESIDGFINILTSTTKIGNFPFEIPLYFEQWNSDEDQWNPSSMWWKERLLINGNLIITGTTPSGT